MENRIEKVLKKYGKPYKKEGDCIVLSVQDTTYRGDSYICDITIKVLDEELEICSVTVKRRGKYDIESSLMTIDNMVQNIIESIDKICI